MVRWYVLGLGLLLMSSPSWAQSAGPRVTLTCESERDKAQEYVRALVITQIKHEALLEQLRQDVLRLTQERDALKSAEAGTKPEARPGQ